MRSRNVKPGFFKNEDLADGGPYAQLLFEGLWCMADKAGRLEDRPRRIKAEIFPYYEIKPGIDPLLKFLAERDFILRYQVGKLKLIQINQFLKHQCPHNTEKPSIFPEPLITCDSLLDNESLTVDSRKPNCGNPPDSLIPDLLITDNLIPDTLEKPLSESPPALPTVKTPSPQNLAKLWNEKAPPELARVNLPLKRQDNDMQKIRNALKRNPEREWWEKVISRLFDSPHCRGHNDRGWKASFDFMVKNAEVILDGKYDGGKGQSAMLDRRTAAQKFIERGQKDG